MFCFVIGFIHLFIEFGLIKAFGSVRTDISPISLVFIALLSFSIAAIVAPRITLEKYRKLFPVLGVCSLAFCIAIHISLLKLAPTFLILFLCGGLFTVLSVFFLASVSTNFKRGYALNLMGSALGVILSCLLPTEFYSKDYPVKPLATDYAELAEKNPLPHRYWNEFGLTETFNTSRGLEIFFNGGLGRSIFTYDDTALAQPSLEPIYETFKPSQVLIIGGIGGGEVSLAKKYQAKNISMIELNNTAFEDLQKLSKPFAQRFEAVKIFPGSVREVLPRLSSRFDLIQLFSVFIPVRDEFYFYPSYTTTTEALNSYVNALSPNGVLHISFNLYIPLILGLQEVYKANGFEGDFFEHILIFDRPTLEDFHPHIFFKKSPWTQEEKDKLYAGFRKFTAPAYVPVDLSSEQSIYQYFVQRNFSDEYFRLKAPTDKDPFIYNSPKIFQAMISHQPIATGTMKNILDRFFSDRWIFMLGLGMMVLSIVTILLLLLRKTEARTKPSIGPVFLYACASIMTSAVLYQRSQFYLSSPDLSALMGVGLVLLAQSCGAISNIRYTWIMIIGSAAAYLLFSEWVSLQVDFPSAFKLMTYILPVGFLFLCGSFLPRIKATSNLTNTQMWLSYACGLIFGFNLINILKFTGYSSIFSFTTVILIIFIMRSSTRPQMIS